MSKIVTFSGGSIDLDKQDVSDVPGMAPERVRELLQGSSLGRSVLFSGTSKGAKEGWLHRIRGGIAAVGNAINTGLDRLTESDSDRMNRKFDEAATERRGKDFGTTKGANRATREANELAKRAVTIDKTFHELNAKSVDARNSKLDVQARSALGNAMRAHDDAMESHRKAADKALKAGNREKAQNHKSASEAHGKAFDMLSEKRGYYE